MADSTFIVRLLCDFERKIDCQATYGIAFDLDSCISTAIDVIRDGICLVGPTSCAGARLIQFPWNRAAIVAMVQWWYFRRCKEITIFNALAEACKSQGATHIQAATHPPYYLLDRFYRKHGLQVREKMAIGQLAD